MNRTSVLIVGAGPTGLALALWLTKLGVDVRIVDKTAAAGTTSRALAVHARTLELYQQLGLADAVVANGHKTRAANLWVAGRSEARIALEDIGRGATAYPFMLIFPQDEHERLLVARLAELGVAVERNTELVGYEERGDGVVARLRGVDGAEQSCEAAYLAGCDGAHSVVRVAAGLKFPGGEYQQTFYVADIAASGPPINGELHIDLDQSDFLAVFPLKGEGRARLVGAIRDERAGKGTLTFEDVSERAITRLKLEVQAINWFSTYRIHHRVAEHFRKGRAFVLGDAAHIHSPVGGQGMNTGIGDAINLAWKLHAVLSGRAPDAVLDSYEIERIAFARRLVHTTDRAFAFISAEGRFAELIRTRVAPAVLPALAGLQAFRNWVFRTVSQVTINYRHSALSAGRAGAVHGGDRLPWLEPEQNYAPLVAMRWQVHVYGQARPELTAWCETNAIPLHIFAWRDAMGEAGLAKDALYLLRPDGYVALAEPGGAVGPVAAYFAQRAIRA